MAKWKALIALVSGTDEVVHRRRKAVVKSAAKINGHGDFLSKRRAKRQTVKELYLTTITKK